MKVDLYCFKFLLSAALLLTVLAPNAGQAQQLGFANSNYAGTHSLYTNPSAIADSRHRFYLHLFSAEAGATNNYLRYDAPFSLLKMARDGREFETDYIKENLNGKSKLVMAGAEVRGPSFMLMMSPKHSIAFTSRVRAGVQVNNLSEDIARLYKVVGDEDESFLGKTYGNQSMNLNANVFSEFGLTYARILFEQESHFLKGGITLKKLAGGYSAHFNSNDSRFSVEERQHEDTESTDYILKGEEIRAKYGFAEMEEFDAMEAGDILGLLAGKNAPGKGWGADLGFTYEYRPDSYSYTMDGQVQQDVEKNKYKYRLAVSVMDIGGINYDNPSRVWAYDITRSNKEINLSALGDAEGTEETLDMLNEALDVSGNEKKTSFRTGLPTALNVNFDYNIKGALYANATWVQGIRGTEAIGMRQNSLLAITPRAEFRKFELALPLALQNNYSVMTVGAMVRFMNFYIGSDNIGGVLNIGNPYGANVYMGVSLFPLLKRNIKDKDKDGVSDDKDKCPAIPGKPELMGCPG